MPNAFRSRAWLLLAASITLQLVILRSVRVLKHDLTSDGLQQRDTVDVVSPSRNIGPLHDLLALTLSSRSNPCFPSRMRTTTSPPHLSFAPLSPSVS
jgi:hypothetical protein